MLTIASRRNLSKEIKSSIFLYPSALLTRLTYDLLALRLKANFPSPNPPKIPLVPCHLATFSVSDNCCSRPGVFFGQHFFAFIIIPLVPPPAPLSVSKGPVARGFLAFSFLALSPGGIEQGADRRSAERGVRSELELYRAEPRSAIARAGANVPQ